MGAEVLDVSVGARVWCGGVAWVIVELDGTTVVLRRATGSGTFTPPHLSDSPIRRGTPSRSGRSEARPVAFNGVVRASSRDVTGNVSETEVTAKFERLGWGVAPNPRHDLGTDLWLMARDERLFDLGLVVGAQVKGGQSWFSEEHFNESGAVDGWWFRDDDGKHMEAWLAHGLPHLVVLHDPDTQISYWVHIVEEAVVRTGKGAKVLVPATNTVDEEHRDDLLRVSASRKPGGAWEGSAWTGAAAVPPSALLRHALIAPRLVAPHPNADHGVTVTAIQAVALLIQARLRDLREVHDKHDDVPTVEDALRSENWDWRLVGALGRRVIADEHEPLVAVVGDAPDLARRAAATVAAAATLMEKGLSGDAFTLLDAVLAADDTDPVDYAWLSVQKARACREVGRRDEARDLAASVQAISVTHKDDLTATALAGVAASILFEVSTWEQQDVASAITSADTTAAWWRAQTTSRALTALTERTFFAWARDTTVRIATSDVANDQLFSAALTASFLGDHGAWRHLSSLLGRDGLLRTDRHTDPAAVSAAVETLRVSGSVDDIKHVVRRLSEDGPVKAVTLAAERIDLDRSTRTTAASDLALLERGGDLLDRTTADRVVQWLLRTLEDSDLFVSRTSPTFIVKHRLVETLARVVPTGSKEVRQLVVTRLAALTPQTDQFYATAWSRVVDSLPEDDWSEESAARVLVGARAHHAALETPLLGVAARYSEEARQHLLVAAKSGSLDALAALGDVRKLPDAVVAALVSSLAARVEAKVEEAHRGTFTMGSHDVGGTLVLLNAWHPALAMWEPIVQLIHNGLVLGKHKYEALRYLTRLADQVPGDWRTPLLNAAQEAAKEKPATRRLRLFAGDMDVTGLAAEVVTHLSAEDTLVTTDVLVGLLGGDEHNRRAAARIAGHLRRAEDTGMLLVLVHDSHPAVRSAAASHLARMVAAGEGGGAALAGVHRAAADPGRRVPLEIAHVLSGFVDPASAIQQVVDDLRGHPSAAVRRAVGQSW